MVASTLATASLLKLYVKWPPPSFLRHAYPTSTLSLRNSELGVGRSQLNPRTLLLGRVPLPRNSRTPAQCGNASHATAFAKVIRRNAHSSKPGIVICLDFLPFLLSLRCGFSLEMFMITIFLMLLLTANRHCSSLFRFVTFVQTLESSEVFSLVTRKVIVRVAGTLSTVCKN